MVNFLAGNVKPVVGETQDRAQAAADWLARAQDATPDGGVSFGYFPCDAKDAWQTSYPETTGYIIPTCLDFAKLTQDSSFRERAIHMANWEVDVQMQSGAVQGGRICAASEQTAASFNTGMVLHGWSRLLAERDDSKILDAAAKAANFLVDDMNDQGVFRTNGAFVSEGVKAYCCLCGWALYLFGDVTDDNAYRQAAVKSVEATVSEQQENGWIRNNSLERTDMALTHTLGYSLQAFLEVGILANRDDFVSAAKSSVDAVIPIVSQNGFLHGSHYSDWGPAMFSSCLTGSAQLAIVMYRLADHLGESKYQCIADQLVNFLKARQIVGSPNDNINGAIAGSFPILGQYMTRGYPNWATKYLLDALMLQLSANQSDPASSFALEPSRPEWQSNMDGKVDRKDRADCLSRSPGR